ncbi:phosphoribosylamine--glycine ligase [Melghirimyces profundicolus]|uniref:Phosphoribosylamine--glycine ligase n=1 Tax=Melghirimyces profundicolus TaxID=1242148 RepID=A0A2T6B3K4_9BACL|nr:phosphoribosylamine--glycine ligase [Melghirimyces profundicolus]PTX50634.1 phosphoribosylamine--glycine ligase [Melghirimyces profundicolus]
MRVLVIGGGGREHALVWKLKQSPRVKEIYCAPGNGGIGEIATCVPIAATDVNGLLRFARDRGIDLTVVGPEAALMAGVVDTFEERGFRIFGPEKAAAKVEGSKRFAKRLMEKYGIPTAAYRTFSDPKEAVAHIREQGAPIVVKADGLAAGKGVVVAGTVEEAVNAVRRMMEERTFGSAGERIVVEECLTGQEMSLMAFVDGETVRPMVPAQDHKPVFDGDRGPNTGGMGSYSPVPQIPEEQIREAETRILEPMARGMVREGLCYRGVLYAGLMITEEGPRVIEFNARFGDPETQAVLPRLEGDLAEILMAATEGRLDKVEVAWRREAALCVVMTSGGYPGPYPKGIAIEALPENAEDLMIFHAGTKRKDGRLVTAGGRVLGVTALGRDLREAKHTAYQTLESIVFQGAHFRKDIGLRAIDSRI